MFQVRKEGFSEREKRILALWKEKNIFKKSVAIREDSPLFSFYDGPPFATGLPHYGHILAGTIKDVVPRYMTMKGFHVPRRFGWDCHGLPVENEIEKTKELSGSHSIEKFGIANFNEECRSIVLRYVEEWKSTVDRMGRWVDFDQTYKTMDPTFMESVWWVFASLWKKDLVYEGFKVMPFSAQLGTPISNFEANLNYKEVTDPSLTVKFPVKGEENTYLLIWTTTPWTLVSNLAAIANPKMTYVKVLDKETKKKYYLAGSRVKTYFKDRDKIEILATFHGFDLSGKEYFPPFEYFIHEASPNAFRVLLDEFVGEEDGTGIVHAAPAFGEADFFVCKREDIEPVCPVDQNGRFTKEIPEYEGILVKDTDKDIIKRLKAKSLVFHHGQIVHRYPFCWRTDQPLIYKAVNTWFVAVEKIKDRLLRANEKINWTPEHIKSGRFGKWLENARDWAISRNRYWGTPIPLWRNDEGGVIVISSIKDLEERVGKKITDLHRHYIDSLTFEENGKVYKRVPEVFDCWFESGSMPYAQNHFPFENKEETLKSFPADFIAEGLDQTRGWFYTLHVLSVALFDQPAFKNVIVNGIILAEDGNKMSKRLKNYPDPSDVFEKYGADSVRLYLLHSPVVEADDLRFSEKGVELILRQFMIPLWNAYVFFATYANIYEWTPSKLEKASSDIDKWILSRLQGLVHDVEKGLDQFLLNKAIDPFVTFIEELTNWYIRRSRNRFWSEVDSVDRRQAFSTLYEVLKTLVKVAAPFVPFISDSIYQEMKREDEAESVHLCDYPIYDRTLRNTKLEQEMDLTQKAVNLGHSLRKEHNLKVRQPLGKAYLISAKDSVLKSLEAHEKLIADELNVKELAYSKDESKFVEISVKPNFPVLGKKVGKLMPQVKQKIEALSGEKIQKLLGKESIDMTVEGHTVIVGPEDVTIERKVRGNIIATVEGDLTIALDTTLTDSLIQEGMAREIVNKINTMRRNMDFDVVDRIKVAMDTNDVVKQAFYTYQEYIMGEVLATDVHFGPTKEGSGWDINGHQAIIHIEKFS